MTLGQVVTNFMGQVFTSCLSVCLSIRLSVYLSVCGGGGVLEHHSRIHHTSPETMHLYVYIKRKFFEFFLIFSTEKNFLQNAVLSHIAAHYIKLILLLN